MSFFIGKSKEGMALAQATYGTKKLLWQVLGSILLLLLLWQLLKLKRPDSEQYLAVLMLVTAIVSTFALLCRVRQVTVYNWGISAVSFIGWRVEIPWRDIETVRTVVNGSEFAYEVHYKKRKLRLHRRMSEVDLVVAVVQRLRASSARDSRPNV